MARIFASVVFLLGSLAPYSALGVDGSGVPFAQSASSISDCYTKITDSAKQKECADAVRSMSAGKTCDDKLDAFNKAYSSFKSDCSSAGISDPAGGPACANNMHACEVCNGQKKDDDNDSGFDCSQYDTLSGSQDSANHKIGYCPALAGQDLQKFRDQYEKYQDDVKKAQDDVDKAKEKVTSLGEKMSQADDELDQKKSEIEDKSGEASSKYRQALDEIQSKAEQTAKQILAAKRDMQDKYDAMSDDITAQRRAKDAAYQKNYLDVRRQLQMACHTSALQQVNEIRTQRLKEIGSSSFTVGGLNAMVNQMGLTDMQRDQQYAYRFYQLCIQDKMYSQQLQGGYEQYALAAATAGDLIDSRKRDQQKNIAEQNRLVQQEIPDTQRDAIRAMDRAHSDMAQAQAQASRDEARAEASAQKKKASIQSQIDLANQQIAQKMQYVADKQALLAKVKATLDAKEQASGGTEIASSDKSKLTTDYADAGATARSLNSCCSSTAQENADFKTNNATSCSIAKSVVKAMDGTDATKDYSSALDDDLDREVVKAGPSSLTTPPASSPTTNTDPASATTPTSDNLDTTTPSSQTGVR